MNSDALKALMKTFKTDSPVLGPVHRHLMSLDPWEDRRKDVIHPSELASDSFCPRAVWYRLMGSEEKQEVVPLVREVIFAAGHEYHEKWQGWLWNAGLLGGRFACLLCGVVFEGVSPMACDDCDAPRRALTYKEVRVWDEETNIGGHADGLVVPPAGDTHLLEVKSVGEGTIRFDSPSLLRQHTHDIDGRKVVDNPGLWRAIKQPLVPHIRQVTIYGRILGVDKAVVLYESKANGQLKEFVISLRFDAVEPRFEAARDIMTAVRTGIAPDCSKRGGGCRNCLPFEKDKDEQATEEAAGSIREQRRHGRRVAAEGRTGTGRAPRGTAPAPVNGRGQSGLTGTDGTVPATRRLVRLRQQPAD